MGKIYILGNKETPEAVKKHADAGDFCSVEDLQLDSDAHVHDFVISRFKTSDYSLLIMDLDVAHPDVMFHVAMTIRLSYEAIRENALLPFVFVSELPLQAFLHYNSEYSQILLTGAGYDFTNVRRLDDVVKEAPVRLADYRKDFLSHITIKPGDRKGRHSIANQWGAQVLAATTGVNLGNIELISETEKSLYFKYCRLNTTGLIDADATPVPTADVSSIRQTSKGKKVLLIDDEANKGWAVVLQNLLPEAELDVFSNEIAGYEGLDAVKQGKIKSNYYDLIFLDLRLNGMKEDESTDTCNMSGYKVLSAIKEVNPGIQVVMLTASNKAWNLQTLLNARANGYYIKESPENGFTAESSLQNTERLITTINSCLNASPLRQIYSDLEGIKNGMLDYGPEFKYLVDSFIDVAFELLTLAFANQETKSRYMAHAYLQLFQIIEAFVSLENVFYDKGGDYYVYGKEADMMVLKNCRKKGESDKSGKKDKNARRYRCPMCFSKGMYQIGDSDYNRPIDTNFKVSAVLIFRYGKADSGEAWKKIVDNRNKKTAHNPEGSIEESDVASIIQFIGNLLSEQPNDVNAAKAIPY